MPGPAANRRDAINVAPARGGTPSPRDLNFRGPAAPGRGRGPPSMLMVRQDSLASVVSDMTMMTYSKEKADMIVEEFHRRAKRSPKDLKDMTEEEKQALVMEIKGEQDAEHQRKKRQEKEARRRAEENERFQRWLEEQEAEEPEEESEAEEPEVEPEEELEEEKLELEEEKNELGEENKEQEKIDRSGRGDLMTRFRALKRTEIVRQERERLAGRRGIKKAQSQPQVSTPEGAGRRGIKKARSQPRVSTPEGEDKEKLSGFREIKPGAKGERPASGDEARKRGLVQSLSSTETARVENVTRHWSSSFSSFFSDGRGVPEIDLDCETEGDRRAQAFQAQTTGQRRGSIDPASVAQIVELKLLAAEQQAAIDTLSFQLHNVELAARRRRDADRARLMQLERENRRLAMESRMHNELEIQRQVRTRDLETENAALRRLLALPFGEGSKREARPSVDTVSTASTDSDSVPHTL